MIVDFNRSPSNSIIYTSSIILEYLKNENNSKYLDDIFNYCTSRNMEYSNFFLSIDWLYLIGIVDKINDRDEVILCA